VFYPQFEKAGTVTAIELASQARYDLLLFWICDRFVDTEKVPALVIPGKVLQVNGPWLECPTSYELDSRPGLLFHP
jgi:hypothetical protein